LWERLQPVRGASFDAAELSRLQTTVSHLTAKGASVILDPHNYARYGGALIGSAIPNSDFADFWSRLAALFKSDSKVLFGLMNEPHDMPTEQWVGAANAAIAAIRATGARNLILVPGNAWTGAHSWSQNSYGTSNAVAMLNIDDPANNYAYEVHQYLDSDSSGTSATCVSATIGSERVQGFTTWLKSHGKKGFLGEFGAGSNTTCLSAIDDLLNHLAANTDVWLGFTYWAAGPWWGSYFMSLEPQSGADAPQMAPVAHHL
jgi:endoglucanase